MGAVSDHFAGLPYDQQPSVPGVGRNAQRRDERAIQRRCYAAVTEADDFLRTVVREDRLTEEQRAEARRIRGLLAEWRLESD